METQDQIEKRFMKELEIYGYTLLDLDGKDFVKYKVSQLNNNELQINLIKYKFSMKQKTYYYSKPYSDHIFEFEYYTNNVYKSLKSFECFIEELFEKINDK